MKEKLAEKLLAKVMEWEPEDYAEEMIHLIGFAEYKYDQYEQFSPGMKYIENLALWLNQFKNKEQKKIAYNFIKNQLIFISKPEMEHLINITYNSIINPILFQEIAKSEGIQKHKLNEILKSDHYIIIQRRCLFLGLSDGAHLDFFRRANNLKNDQVSLTYHIYDEKLLAGFKEKLKEDLIKINPSIKDDECTFECVFLLDDFSGSSDTLLRKESEVKMDTIPSTLCREIERNEWGGKLWYKKKEKQLVFKGNMDDKNYQIIKSKLSNNNYQKSIQDLYEKTQKKENNLKGKLNEILIKIHQLQDKESPIISKNAKVIIILYIATQFAIETLEKNIKSFRQPWWPEITIEAVQKIKNDSKVSELKENYEVEKFIKLLEEYYDENIMDEHLLKGGSDVIHGYNSCSLPLILYHNTPNNSIYLFWAETDKIRPLFKRVSRHKVE